MNTCAALPAIVLDESKEKIYFDTTCDITSDLETFYRNYLDGNIDAFAVPKDYANGFYSMMAVLEDQPGEWIKGQVTGPISFGLTVTNQDLRASLYDEQLVDTIVKNSAMVARWQIHRLHDSRPNVIIFVDEPYMASFGSTYINLGRKQVVAMLNEVFEAIQSEGALAGVHCCANTDWSLLLDTKVNILNLDAFGYMEKMALYPTELRRFLDRGGVLAWGIVPNTEDIFRLSPAKLADRLKKGVELICTKAAARNVTISPDEFKTRSLLTPSCGLGPASIEIADQAFDKLFRLRVLMQ
jgi:hypothetical protein